MTDVARVPARTTALAAAPLAPSRVVGIVGNLIALALLICITWAYLGSFSCMHCTPDGNVAVAQPLARALPPLAMVVEGLIAFALRRQRVALLGATLTLVTVFTVVLTGIVAVVALSMGVS